MDTIQELEAKRDAILFEMKSIRSMKRGTINEQYLHILPRRKRQGVKRGPYYVFSRYDAAQKRTVSWRLTTPEELERARREVAVHKRFVTLCEDFERLTERLGEIERGGAALEGEKKRRRWQSRRSER